MDFELDEPELVESRYNFRKRKNENTDIEQQSKIIKAMLAMLEPKSKEYSLPATEVNGIKIPITYKQAISDIQYGDDWKAAI